ncbi:unnamed protein product [Rangifer tarandus platyrhynchus]|uniref:Uncharacterized protein n=1 Tax=Rangifer tarandus platyrhynchus TaxID=3082113 RepID=A0AC60A249_RANTA
MFMNMSCSTCSTWLNSWRMGSGAGLKSIQGRCVEWRLEINGATGWVSSWSLGVSLLVDVQLSWVENGDSETHPELVSKSSSATAAAKSLQSCATLCNPIDGRPPGSAIPGILQA